MANHWKIALALALLVPTVPVFATDSDPTRPLGYRTPSQDGAHKLTLGSILVSEHRRVAVINNKLAREGDTVAGAKVIKILHDRVQLEVAGKRRELKLNSTTVKRTAKTTAEGAGT